MTSHFQEGCRRSRPSGWAGEYVEPDYNTMGEVLASACRASAPCTRRPAGGRSCRASTTRRCSRSAASRSWSLALRTRRRRVLGLGRALPRGRAAPLFGAAETAFLRTAGPAARRAALGTACAPAQARRTRPPRTRPRSLVPRPTASRLRRRRPRAERWLAAPAAARCDRLPGSVVTVGRAGRCGPRTVRRRHGVRGTDGALGAASTARCCGADGSAHVSVLVEAAQPAHLETLLMQAHGLTPRERDVTRLVLRGRSTARGRRRAGRRRGHGAAAPQVGLREDRRTQPARAGRLGVPGPLRAAGPRQRPPRRHRPSGARRPDAPPHRSSAV